MDLDSRPGVVMMPAVCTDRPRQIRKAQRASRDALIDLAGERRTSEVWFAQYHGAEAARNAMRNLGIDADPTPADLAHLDQVHTFLTALGNHAVLIVAACEVTHD
jgi:hypothetical protein